MWVLTERLAAANKGTMMTSKERVLASLNHREPDRVPIDLGGHIQSSINLTAYKNLCSYLASLGKISPLRAEPNLFDPIQRLPILDEDILRYFGVDTRCYEESFPYLYGAEYWEDDSNCYFKDEWGIEWFMAKPHGLFFEVRNNPLRGLVLDEIKRRKFPDPTKPGRYEVYERINIGARFRKISRNYAIVCMQPIGVGIFTLASWLRGMDDFMVDMALGSDVAEYLLRTINEIYLEAFDRFLRISGQFVDVVMIGDDVCTQQDLMISKGLFDKYLKPRYQELIEVIRSRSGAKIVFHSDGNIYRLIPDLMEIGVDAINPVQTNIPDMEIGRLKQEFGAKLSFWGAACDVQETLPFGTPDHVRREVTRSIDVLLDGGGYVLAPIHNIQAEVPPKNIDALFSAALGYRRGAQA